MSLLRRGCTQPQARALADRLHFAETELRLAVADVGGMDRRTAGRLVKMIRDLQAMRLDLPGEPGRGADR